MPDALPKLAYARDGSTPARAWTRRIVLFAWALLTAYLAYDKWGGRARLQVDLLMAQSRCLTFVEPKDRVIFETEDARFPALLREQGYVGVPRYYNLVDAPRLGTADGPAPARSRDVAVVSTLASAPLHTFRAARAALDQWDRSRRPAPAPAATLFGNDLVGSLYGIGPDALFAVMTHRRRVSDGPERLVTVDGEWYAMQNRLAFHAHVVAPATAFGRAEDVSGGAATPQATPFSFLMPVRPGARWVQLYAGQPDPNDAARVTWDYETPAGRGTFEGRLRADDTVDLRAVSGPALSQPSLP